ncbi:hypothetical protein Gpo141_00000255 [Globisporangium polare]
MATAVAAATTVPPPSPPQVSTAAHGPLTGFVRIEDDGDHRKTKGNKAKGKVCSRWHYGVLLPGKLQLYARRQDYKRQTPPSDEIHMQVRARSANESVFGFDQECVYIRSSDTGQVITVRIHQKKDIVRWVTALYYQSFSSSKSPNATSAALASGKHDRAQQPEPTDTNNQTGGQLSTRAKRKSVSFQEEPEVRVLPRQSYDPADLFYSEREYEQFFQQKGGANGAADEDDTQPPKKNLSRMMKSIIAKTAAKLKVSPKKSMDLER